MIYQERERLGARLLPGGGCRFLVWAPSRNRVDLHLLSPGEQTLAMRAEERGYWILDAPEVGPGSRYLFRLDNEVERPDPASRAQPEGVHGPSEVVDALSSVEEGGWQGIPISEYVIYELHVGTFTEEGTFGAVIPLLQPLQELGVTAIELMPVAQFPGRRNWGYDGVNPFAAHTAYGGLSELRRLLDACHEIGLAAILDVVYNHLGPEGNYLADFGPYFTHAYHTPWGPAVNLDGPGSDEVRRFFIENALWWTVGVGFDALRLDALHALIDRSAQPFLGELTAEVRAAGHHRGRLIQLIGESDANDARLLLGREQGGYGLDAQWNDDFHHSLHALLTGEKNSYYVSFGSVEHLARAYEEGFVYTGQYSPSRQRRHGSSSRSLEARRFVVYSQNHDQIGNRAQGERLPALVPYEALKLAASAVLLSPFLPLLFMGEEYGEPTPFLYFTDHADPELGAAVREGRRKEFIAFGSESLVADPQEEETFRRSKLDWDLRERGEHATLLSFYRKLLQLRRDLPALRNLDKERQEVGFSEEQRMITLLRRYGENEVFLALHLSEKAATRPIIVPPGDWLKELDSAEERWLGPGSPAPWVLSSSVEHALLVPPYGVLLYRRGKD